jgi:hypothetical protein
LQVQQKRKRESVSCKELTEIPKRKIRRKLGDGQSKGSVIIGNDHLLPSSALSPEQITTPSSLKGSARYGATTIVDAVIASERTEERSQRLKIFAGSRVAQSNREKMIRSPRQYRKVLAQVPHSIPVLERQETNDSMPCHSIIWSSSSHAKAMQVQISGRRRVCSRTGSNMARRQ